ncbi:MAG: LptF/LptG family permease [Bacteroidota bacterium]
MWKPRKLDVLILKAYAGPFLMSFAIILFILVMQFMSLYMNEIFGKGLGGGVILQLFIFAAGRLAITAMPVAILAGALMTYGSMGEHYELAAIKSGGISIFKTMRPLILLALMLTGISLWFSFDLIPRANLKFFSLLYDVQRKKPDVAIKPGYFYSDIDGYIIRVSDKNLDNGRLYDVMIYDHTENRGNVNIMMADSATTSMEGGGQIMKMVLYSGSRHEDYRPESGKPDTYRHGRTYFDSLYYKFNLSGFDLDRTDENQFKHQITLVKDDLKLAIDSLTDLNEENLAKHIVQVGRYTKVDTVFLKPGIYQRGTRKNKDSTESDSLSSDNSDLLKLEKMGEKVDKKPINVEDLEKGKPIIGQGQFDKANYVYDTLAVDTIHLSEGGILASKIEGNDSDALELLNKALVNVRSVQSYLEFLMRKKDDEGTIYRKYLYEYYSRHAIPLNCLLFMLIGSSLGAIIRKGGLGVPSLISIIFFLAFYVMITQGKKLSRADVLDPLIGAFLPVIIFAPIAIYVTYQATNDSRLLDEGSWAWVRDKISMFFSSLRQRFSKKAKAS